MNNNILFRTVLIMIHSTVSAIEPAEQDPAPLTGLEIFETTKRHGSQNFTFVECLSNNRVRGSRVNTPALTVRDISRMALVNQEFGTMPITGVAILFRTDSAKKLASDRLLQSHPKLVIVVAGEARAVVNSVELRKFIDTKTPLFVALPIKTSKEYYQVKSTLAKIAQGRWRQTSSKN